MGEAAGRKGVWAYVEGGMGRVSEAAAAAARRHGAEIVTSAAVERILTEGGVAVGVALADGSKLEAATVSGGQACVVDGQGDTSACSLPPVGEGGGAGRGGVERMFVAPKPRLDGPVCGNRTPGSNGPPCPRAPGSTAQSAPSTAGGYPGE